jgi:shikimate kinase
VVSGIELDHTIVSTGGSVVYSAPAMQRLCSAGPVVYLAADLATLEQRVAAAPLRGIASDRQQTYAQVFAERTPLYHRYADLTVDAAAGSADEVADRILRQLLP